ncbi:hypothetical protein TNCT_729511 [Trichonephila clavata]|uniref:Uncharacterized protein n=1 Tax=Trichonephila clavata TaxID=2740835 RepID=A0A8X6HI47_TRICU|nr:hypothetical protein TNCT_729511 [Trichonephila clavata]
MTRRKQQRPIHVDNPEEGISFLNNAEMNNPNNEGNCSMEQENGDDISDPPTDTNPLPPDVHCAHIRTLQKQIRHGESRIRQQEELIDIETFDQRDTDAAQLQSYIHAKGAAELDYNVKMGELKLFFPCPVKNCSHNTTNGLNATRSLKKRAAEPCILAATFNPRLGSQTPKNQNQMKPLTKIVIKI